ncbi:O-antigen polymerase [Tautonia sociabilis]|uniref:Oligosaccharide repeat unit polymerase n=1 Tax=Tautonia sociabilis TaxID=2080755 RepID=A0A432MI92_9BACT|nr:O-antigen polymerase [Tautonia sociabilis]RUL87084.1 oligosaccharide repeat unit polymerase [Tautonia sociabilis]
MLTLMALTTLAGVAALSRLASGSWMAPSALLAMVWLGISAPSLLGAQAKEVPAVGLAWVAFSCVAFALGDLVGQAVAGGPKQDATATAGDGSGARRLPLPAAMPLVVAGTVAGLAFLAIRTATVGVSWYGEDDVPTLLKPIYVAQFATPALCGLAAAADPRRRWWALALISLLPAAATTFISTKRAILLLAILHWIAGYLSARVFLDRGRSRLFSGRRLALLSAAAAALVLSVFVAAACRYSLTGRERSVGDLIALAAEAIRPGHLLEQWPKIRHLFFGYAPTFCQWFERSWGRFPPAEFGSWTFSGPFTLLGIADRPYAEEFEISPGVWTNVYGALHGLILDFSPIGSLLALVTIGLVGGASYRRMASGSVLALPVLATVYVAVLFSFISSPMRYNVVCFATVYIAIYAGAQSRSLPGRPAMAPSPAPARPRSSSSPALAGSVPGEGCPTAS